MVDYEIMDYVRQGIILTGLYLTVRAGMVAKTLFSEKINSQKQLDRIIKEESKKLGLDSITVFGIFKKDEEVCFTDEYNPTLYVLSIGGKDPNICDVKHELYHLKKDRPLKLPENKIKKFCIEVKNLFVEEPKARLYETFGIKF